MLFGLVYFTYTRDRKEGFLGVFGTTAGDDKKVEFLTCRWSAELPEAAAAVEALDGEHAAAAVPDDQEPPGADAARARELLPPAPQERAVAVLTDLDGPDLLAGAGRAKDEGLRGADFLGELVGNALRNGKTHQFPCPGVTGARALWVLPGCRR